MAYNKMIYIQLYSNRTQWKYYIDTIDTILNSFVYHSSYVIICICNNTELNCTTILQYDKCHDLPSIYKNDN